MKVRDLIEKLKEFESDAEIRIITFREDYDNFENERCVSFITASKHVQVNLYFNNMVEIYADNFEES